MSVSEMHKIIAIALIFMSGLISGITCAYSIYLRETNNSIAELSFITSLAFLPFIVSMLCIRKNKYLNMLVVFCSFVLSYKGSLIYYQEIVLDKDPSYSFTVLMVPFILQTPLFFLMAGMVAAFYRITKHSEPKHIAEG
jgi:hypothetical protein